MTSAGAAPRSISSNSAVGAQPTTHTAPGPTSSYAIPHRRGAAGEPARGPGVPDPAHDGAARDPGGDHLHVGDDGCTGGERVVPPPQRGLVGDQVVDVGQVGAGVHHPLHDGAAERRQVGQVDAAAQDVVRLLLDRVDGPAHVSSSLTPGQGVEPAQGVAQAHHVTDDGRHRGAQAGGGDVVGEVLERADDDRWLGGVPSWMQAAGVPGVATEADERAGEQRQPSWPMSTTSVAGTGRERLPAHPARRVLGVEVAGDDADVLRPAARGDGDPGVRGAPSADEMPGTTSNRMPSATSASPPPTRVRRRTGRRP
jgi:hypothetical protein